MATSLPTSLTSGTFTGTSSTPIATPPATSPFSPPPISPLSPASPTSPAGTPTPSPPSTSTSPTFTPSPTTNTQPVTNTTPGSNTIPGISTGTTNSISSPTSSSLPTGLVFIPPGSDGASPGVVAGAAIGCLLGGALIGFLIAFFLLKKRQSRGTYTPAPVAPAVNQPRTQYTDKAALVAHNRSPQQDALQLDQFLLDATPDAEIDTELRALGQLLRQHVETHYHRHPVNATDRDLQAMSLALNHLGLGDGSDGSLTPETVTALAFDPHTRPVALQHVISRVVFTSIDAPARSRLSMLPAPIAAFLQSIPPYERGRVNGEAYGIALNKWRALSAFLLHPSRSERTPLLPSETAIHPQAAALANMLDGFLGYFVAGDEASKFQQRSHLQAVISECTKLGYTILSQPGGWQFIHTMKTPDRARMAVVCAGLMKVVRADGTLYDMPHQVVAPSVVQV